MKSDPIGYTEGNRDLDNHTPRVTWFGAAAFALALLVACSSDDSSTPSSSGSALEAPALDAVEPMAGGLHVRWTSHQHDCDAVEGERKSGSGQFEQVFTVPGSADNEMDGTATDPTVSYTYRVRCKKGAAYSAYSNELSGTP